MIFENAFELVEKLKKKRDFLLRIIRSSARTN